jgi:hypothetical protein
VRSVCRRRSVSQQCSWALAFDGTDLAGLLLAPFRTPSTKREGCASVWWTQPNIIHFFYFPGTS